MRSSRVPQEGAHFRLTDGASRRGGAAAQDSTAAGGTPAAPRGGSRRPQTSFASLAAEARILLGDVSGEAWGFFHSPVPVITRVPPSLPNGRVPLGVPVNMASGRTVHAGPRRRPPSAPRCPPAGLLLGRSLLDKERRVFTFYFNSRPLKNVKGSARSFPPPFGSQACPSHGSCPAPCGAGGLIPWVLRLIPPLAVCSGVGPVH